ncbi:hypothetical protein Bca101_058813 [Brassica carinata]
MSKFETFYLRVFRFVLGKAGHSHELDLVKAEDLFLLNLKDLLSAKLQSSGPVLGEAQGLISAELWT